jgi:hypothetical protein
VIGCTTNTEPGRGPLCNFPPITSPNFDRFAGVHFAYFQRMSDGRIPTTEGAHSTKILKVHEAVTEFERLSMISWCTASNSGSSAH